MPEIGRVLTPDPTVYTNIRGAYLDNIDASLKELFYEHFRTTVDDYPNVTASGTASNPQYLIDDDLSGAEYVTFTANQYVEIDFGLPVYCKQVRFYWIPGSNPNNRYRLQAYVDGAWVDALTEIVDIDSVPWGDWLDLTTPRTAVKWRLQNTTFDTASQIFEMELLGVGVGG